MPNPNERALTVPGTTNLAAAKKRRDELAREHEERSTGPIMKLTEGRNLLRFLPPPRGVDLPFLETWVHFIRNPGQNLKTFVCPNRMVQKKCVICERVSQLRRGGSATDDKQAKDLAAKRQVFANVVDMQNPGKGVQILRFGVMIYEDLLEYMTDEQTGGDFTSVENGYTVVIERTGTDQSTRYSVRLARSPTPIQDKAWLTQQHDLKGMGRMLDEASMLAALNGQDSDSEFPPVDARGNVADDLDV